MNIPIAFFTYHTKAYLTQTQICFLQFVVLKLENNHSKNLKK